MNPFKKGLIGVITATLATPIISGCALNTITRLTPSGRLDVSGSEEISSFYEPDENGNQLPNNHWGNLVRNSRVIMWLNIDGQGKVVAAICPDDVLGHYTYGTRTVVLCENQMDTSSPSLVMETLNHEAIHLAQDCVERDYIFNEEQLIKWLGGEKPYQKMRRFVYETYGGATDRSEFEAYMLETDSFIVSQIVERACFKKGLAFDPEFAKLDMLCGGMARTTPEQTRISEEACEQRDRWVKSLPYD